MAKVGAQRASELTGRSKSTVQRAMNSGKLSYEVDENGRRLIDVSELDRVFGLTPQRNESAAPVIDNSAMAELERARHNVEIDRMKVQVRLLEEQLEQSRMQIEDLKVQRDLWQKQAQQVLLTSQYSQKQAEERIQEMQLREEQRRQAVEQRRQQMLQAQQAQKARAQAQARAIQAGNQNVPDAQVANKSFFGNLFGSKKKAVGAAS